MTSVPKILVATAAAGFMLAAGLFNTAIAADTPAAAPSLIPLKDFTKEAEFTKVKISPNGEYLAVTFPIGDQDTLVFVNLADKKLLSKLEMGPKVRVHDFWWVGPKRVVVAPAQQYGALEQPLRTGELLGVDADGGGQKYLFGYRAAQTAGTNIKGAERRAGYATMINPLPNDPNYALIAIEDANDGEKHGRNEVARLNVNNGATNSIDSAPTPGTATFLADDTGIARYVYTVNEHSHAETFVRLGDEKLWKPLNTGDLADASILPQALSGNGKRALLLSDEGTGRYCLIEQALDTGAKKTLSCDPVASAQSVILSFDQREAIGAYYNTAAPWQRLLDTANPDRDQLAKLQKSFPGQVVIPTSATRDGSLVVLAVFSDRNPGDYYLFNTKTSKAEYLASVRSLLDPEQTAERRPMDFKTRDGVTIHGFVTLPPGRAVRGLPLIVNPHGGPFFVHDGWTWDDDAQVLASRGYAVLQVNFRGSDGYGGAYEQAARQGWDTVMINDITDATRSLIEQGMADGARVCIYGASYGGFAALMSAVREPSLYRCTIGYAGIYDLVSERDNSDTAETAGGRTFFKEFVGETTEKLRAASPLTYIDQLKAAVMIIHGASDERVPVSQARALRKALDARKIPYEWLIKDDEGHGFYKPENKLELYTKMLAFIGKNIGPGAPVTTAVAAEVPAAK